MPSGIRVRSAARAGSLLFGSAYALWLRKNQGVMEPDYTWLEVAVGVAVTLLFAYIEERWDRQFASGVLTALVHFFITGSIVAGGEIYQVLERQVALIQHREARNK